MPTTPSQPLRLALGDEAGHSLIEAAVATALMLTVLVPLGGATAYLLAARVNEPHTVALALGQQAMERTLHERRYTSAASWLDDGRWHVTQTVTRQGQRVMIVVRVFRRHRPRPMVELMTVRVFP